DYREAFEYFEPALLALGHLPESRDTQLHAVDLRVDLTEAFMRSGQHGRCLDYLREAERLAEALDDQRRLGQVAADMATYYWATGDHDRAIQSSQRALTSAVALGDLHLQVRANYSL